MKNTRFMERLFSACNAGDEELVNQVANDIEEAKSNPEGRVETDELEIVNLGEGKVLVTDKENKEQTVVEQADAENYDMYPAEVSEQIEGFAHPEEDGVTPGDQVGAPDEDIVDHVSEEDVVDPVSVEEEVEEHEHEEAGAEEVCPKCGKNPCECEEEHAEEEEEEEKHFSNSVIARIYSDQSFCERLFSEVIESEETAKVGSLKIEKVEDEDAVVVTNVENGDQAKVEMSDDEMNVTELEAKSFAEEGDAVVEEPAEEEVIADEADNVAPLHVVGVDAENHVLVDALEYTEESAHDLANKLCEDGVDAVEILNDEEAARDYASDLLNSLGAEVDEEDNFKLEEPEQVEFSDHTIYKSKYFSTNTVLMDRLFSEACNDESCPSQAIIEDAIKSGEEIEVDNAVVTPVDEKTAVIEDKENGEFTKAIMDDDKVSYNKISEEEADKLTEDLMVEEDKEEKEEEEKEFSVYCNEAETRFFSENETLTSYMQRLFSEEADQADIEKAIDKDEVVETETEVITPVDEKTAVIEDKENGEFTKAVVSEEDIEVEPISKEEAEELTAEEKEEEEEKPEEVEVPAVEEPVVEEKKYSVSNPMDKFFAEVANGSPVISLEPGQSFMIIDPEGNPVELKQEEPVAPVEGEEVPAEEVPAEKAEEEVPSVEAIEDKALAAVQSIQAAASEAEAQILNAKAQPAENQEADLKEAQFSNKAEKNFSNLNDTLASWLNGTRL